MNNIEQIIINNYKNNLEIFKIYLPNIYNLLNKSNKYNYSIEINNNNINVLKDGKPIYPDNTKEYFNNLLNRYELNGNNNLLRYNISTPPIDNSKEHFGINLYHSKYIIKVIKNYKKIFNKIPFEQEEILNQDFIYTGLIYGIGLGYHIMPLINRYKFRHLILADIDIEMLRVSLYTINWYEIIEYFAEDTTKSFSIILKNNNIDKIITTKLYDQYPLSYYNTGEFISYKSEDIENLNSKIKEFRELLFPISGFFDDEKWGLQHTIHNIKENIPILTNNSIQVDKEKFVFVIGNGPSLDDYIKVVKKYKDNAIVIASGSALNSLYLYGIIPNIYISIERTIDMYQTIKDLPIKYLNKITFIGMNTTHPRVFQQFKKRFIFLKDNDTGTKFINNSKYKLLNYSNPTVTNGALSLTISLGFKNICLFGMDFGYKDNKHHHSKNSFHNNKENIYYTKRMSNNIQLEGVDGDIIYTQDIYNNSRIYIELLIQDSPKDINVYNFSNGSKIEGTTRIINPKDIKLHKQKINKKKVCKSIKKQFSLYKKDINIDYNILNKKIKILEKMIKKYNNKNITIYQYLKFFDIFYKKFRVEFQDEFKYLHNLYNGTLITILGMIYSYSSLNSDNKETSLFIYKSLNSLNKFLKESRKDILTLETKIDTPFKWRDNG